MKQWINHTRGFHSNIVWNFSGG